MAFAGCPAGIVHSAAGRDEGQDRRRNLAAYACIASKGTGCSINTAPERSYPLSLKWTTEIEAHVRVLVLT